MDMTKPDAQAFMVWAAEHWDRYCRTHTPADIDQLDAQIAKNRALRAQMFGGRVTRVVTQDTAAD